MPPETRLTAADQIADLVDALRRATVAISEEELHVISLSTNLDQAVQTASVMTGLAPYTLTSMAKEAALTETEGGTIGRAVASRTGGTVGTVFQPDGSQVPINAAQARELTDSGATAIPDPQTGRPIFVPAPDITLDAAEEDLEPFAGGFPMDNPDTLRNETYRPVGNPLARGRRSGGGSPTANNTAAWGREPLYLQFDAWRQFGGRSPEYIAEVKTALIAAGIIDEDQAGPMGHWRGEDAQVMGAIMAEANGSGKTWTQVIEEYGAAFEPESKDRARAWRAANPFIAPVFKSPDYASLAQAVRGAFGQQVGRDPKDYELALLADQMRADFNGQHASNIAAARQTYEATARGVETESPQSAGTVQDVDPMARLMESVLARYQPEIENREAVEENEMNVGLMMRSLTGMDRMVG